VHTTGDGLVIPPNEAAYAQVVGSANSAAMLRQVFVHRAGHCAFTPAETIAALQVLLKRMDTGRWDDAALAPSTLTSSALSMGDGTYCLGVLKSIQEAAGVKQGDTVTVELELDTALRLVELPADLAKAIARDKKATAAWDALSYTNKKEMSRSLEEAKQPE